MKYSDHHNKYLYIANDQSKLPLDMLYSLFKSQIKTLQFNDYQSYILESMDDIMGFTFQPGKAKLINTSVKGWFNFNTYKSYKPKSESIESDISIWIEFLKRLFPDDEERNVVCQYLAHMIQKPAERPSWHLLLTSDTGTGKGYLFSRILQPLLMGQVYQASSYSEITRTHSVAFDGTLLLMLDDPKSMQESTMTQIKSKLSEAQVSIERKYEQARIQRIFTRVILASNEFRPLKLEQNERRWFAPTYINHKQDTKETQSFIEKMDLWLSKGGIDAVYNWLNSFSLEGFNSKHIYQTATLKTMIEQSVPVVVDELKDWLETNNVFKWEDLRNQFNHVADNLLKKYLTEFSYTLSRPEKNKVKYRVWHPIGMDIQEVKNTFF